MPSKARTFCNDGRTPFLRFSMRELADELVDAALTVANSEVDDFSTADAMTASFFLRKMAARMDNAVSRRVKTRNVRTFLKSTPLFDVYRSVDNSRGNFPYYVPWLLGKSADSDWWIEIIKQTRREHEFAYWTMRAIAWNRSEGGSHDVSVNVRIRAELLPSDDYVLIPHGANPKDYGMRMTKVGA